MLGKSICYQVPALLLEGTTIVISPLISLMKDQVDTLTESGIPCAYLNSTLSSSEFRQTIENASYGMYRILYIAPERLNSESFSYLLKHLTIPLIAIDEAHCVSRWGHDFRPSYQEIADVILNLPVRPIVSAFTATATEVVKEDIISLLHLENPFLLTTGFDRKNLYFSVKSPDARKNYLFSYLTEKKDQSGIVYCLTRKNVDELYEEATHLGFSVSRYHAGMTEKQRSESQEDFVYDRTHLMIATNAFGMGIDKSNIRFVVHYQMPRDLESYYQEAGRAGRDGGEAECILLFHRSDVVMNKFLIEQNSSENSNHKNEYQKLNDMVDYCHTDKCLRRTILTYFGEVPNFDRCENCGNCDSDIQVTDITVDSQKILSCIKRMHERYGIGLVADVLKGSRSAKIKSLHFDELSTHGIMQDYAKNTIKDLISFLITEEYIQCVGDQYPILVLTPKARLVLSGEETVLIQKRIEKLPDSLPAKSKIDLCYDEELFTILRNLRKQVSSEMHVPPFIIFTDVSLKQMCIHYPTTAQKMLKIEGVGNHKLQRYGQVFISTILDYVTEHGILVSNDDDEVADSPSSDEMQTIVSTPQCSSREDTKQVSYELFCEGKSIDEIASIRQLTKQTIQNHLITCYQNGLPMDLEREVQTQYRDCIYEAIEKFGIEKLKPLKEALPSEVSYLDIRYYVCEYEKNR